MKTKDNESFHVGVYGICVQDSKILLIEKARGPYKGTFDLPGGSIEFGEKVEETLKREMLEETDAKVENFAFFDHSEYVSEYMGKHEPLKMHHIGLYYIVDISGSEVKQDADGEDSLGAKFIEINKLSEIKIAPIAKPMIESALKKIGLTE